jgi:hypothetical protein
MKFNIAALIIFIHSIEKIYYKASNSNFFIFLILILLVIVKQY